MKHYCQFKNIFFGKAILIIECGPFIFLGEALFKTARRFCF